MSANGLRLEADVPPSGLTAEEEQERRMQPPVNLRRYEPLCGPPVRLHPDTQRPVVWTSPAHLEHYEGYSAAESRELLEALLLPGTTSSAVYAHCWEQGDVVVWDNRRTIHSTTKSDGTSALLYQVGNISHFCLAKLPPSSSSSFSSSFSRALSLCLSDALFACCSLFRYHLCLSPL